MRELLRRGATVDVTNRDGGTALMAACQLGAYVEAKVLLDHGADVNWRNGNGAGALHTAAAYKRNEVLSLLLDAPGVYVDLQTTDGHTPLMSAAGVGADSCVRLLLDAGADTELCGQRGQTALRCAEVKGHASTQLLLQRACSPPNSPSEVASAGKVLLKLRDGRRVHVPESNVRRTSPTESPAARRILHRAAGLLARDLRE
jgi:ankyrin repeat protein